jgi:hypothetical protein
VLVVILLLGWGVFRPKSTTSVASNSTYCTTLHTIATAPPTDLSSPSQRAQAKQWMATLDTSAPASIKSSTHAFVTTTDKLIANPLAGTPAQAASLLADKTAMVAWAQTNCPAGTMPSAASPTTHPTATPTPTTAPAAATSGISGGPQTLPTPEGSPVSVNITSAQANPPKIEGAADTSPTILAIELTVSNNGTTAVDLSNLLTSDPSITLGEGVTSLTPQFDTTDPLAPGATTTGWATLDYDSATAAPYTIVLSFANVSSSTVASWTISS